MRIIEIFRDQMDIQAINKLITQLTPGKEKSITLGDLDETFANPNFHLFVAISEDAKEYYGMASLFFQRNLGSWMAQVHDVVVDEAQRGKRIGLALNKKLLKFAQTFADENGEKVEISLTSRPSRVAANELYKELGYELAATACGERGTNLYKKTIKPNGLRGLT